MTGFGAAEMAAVMDMMARIAAEEITPRFRGLGAGDIGEKTGPADLVTVADTRAEARLTEELLRRFPGARVTGEETAEPGFDYAADPLLFVIDPVDGTWNFANGLPVFGSMVSVLSGGNTIAGLIHYPLEGDFLHARAGGGAWRQRPGGPAARLQQTGRRGAQPTGLFPHTMFDSPTHVGAVRALAPGTRLMNLQCSAYDYRMLAEGGAQFSLAAGLKPWDHCAGLLILSETGGHAALSDGTAWRPGVPTPATLIAAADMDTWQEVREALAAVLPLQLG
ncbi:inositol monophosphatase [Paroceanicella profunda]|uniref:Inositol monophosphatase n=1 Tax=Paroceanicella profunda TaxID=2579971 RepID=A0A5B8FGN7_9RHOB|nr:inositol monophosphatase [Paroceanicella profunda]QDL91207.1 inositol monophosphatase [Paroceanicella profunda]